MTAKTGSIPLFRTKAPLVSCSFMNPQINLLLETAILTILSPYLAVFERPAVHSESNLAFHPSSVDDKRWEVDVLTLIKPCSRRQVRSGNSRSVTRTSSSDLEDTARGKRERA